mmetsp:Transcript_196/g.520  ORF Transcript_196/g.520 Transcript_196/m.520 type:complete len:224 (-) Transcript_196:420-1091(-)
MLEKSSRVHLLGLSTMKLVAAGSTASTRASAESTVPAAHSKLNESCPLTLLSTSSSLLSTAVTKGSILSLPNFTEAAPCNTLDKSCTENLSGDLSMRSTAAMTMGSSVSFSTYKCHAAEACSSLHKAASEKLSGEPFLNAAAACHISDKRDCPIESGVGSITSKSTGMDCISPGRVALNSTMCSAMSAESHSSSKFAVLIDAVLRTSISTNLLDRPRSSSVDL